MPTVHCKHDKIISPSNLKPNPANPNRHPKPQVELLAKIIAHNGWRCPVTVSNLSGLIVRGHGRRDAALLLGVDVPVEFQDYASEADELADMIADNAIAAKAELDGQMMADLICELDQQNFDLELTGLTEQEVQDFVEGPSGDIEADSPTAGYTVVCDCDNADIQRDVLADLTKQGYTCRLG